MCVSIFRVYIRNVHIRIHVVLCSMIIPSSHTQTLLNNVLSRCRHCPNFCTSCPLTALHVVGWLNLSTRRYVPQLLLQLATLRRVVTYCSCLHIVIRLLLTAIRRQLSDKYLVCDEWTTSSQCEIKGTSQIEMWLDSIEPLLVIRVISRYCPRMRMRHTAGAASENVYWLWIFLNMLLLRRFCCGVSCGSPTIYRSWVSLVLLGAINCYGV